MTPAFYMAFTAPAKPGNVPITISLYVHDMMYFSGSTDIEK